MAIDLKAIQALRDKTGMGMTQCKKALEDAGGDVEKAEMVLRKLGLDKAAKKADRPTGQGVVQIRRDGDRAAMIELACEQEPTTANELFTKFVDLALTTALAVNARSAEELLAAKSPDGTIKDSVTNLIAHVGENVVLKKAGVVAAPAGGVLGQYLHFNKKAGALVALELSGAKPEAMRTAANDTCMHAVAARPLAMDRAGISEDVLAKEKELFMEEVNKKPEAIREKILDGKLKKFYGDKVLTEQLFIKDPEGKTTVQQMLDAAAKEAGGTAKVVGYLRFELGL